MECKKECEECGVIFKVDKKDIKEKVFFHKGERFNGCEIGDTIWKRC